MSERDCKELALKGNFIIAIVSILIISVITAGLGSITAGLGTFILTSVLSISLYNVFINGYKKGEYNIMDMYSGLTDGLQNRIILSVLKNVYIILWSLLFFIPGIVKMYSYYLAEFISREHPEKTATECIEESIRRMDGHKADLFLFQLSFIGWMLLGTLTFGILYIWLIPYMHQATIIFIDKNIYELSASESKNNDYNNNDHYYYNTTASYEEDEWKYCYKCGEMLDKTAQYCHKCGTKQKQ